MDRARRSVIRVVKSDARDSCDQRVDCRFGRSIPLLLIAAVTVSEARYAISRFDALISFEPATTAAEKTETYCTSVGTVVT